MSYQVLRAPSQTVVSPGVVALTGSLAKQFGTQALICTDSGVAGSPALGLVRNSLDDSGIRSVVFDGGQPELPLANLKESLSFASRRDFDFVVGLGGGSSIDMAKLTSLLTTFPQDPSTFYGEAAVPGPIKPVVAIPTTAGTGSEVTPVAVLDDPSRDLKVGVSSPYLVPRIAICDAELTFSCPPRVTAFAGIDALVHAVEAFTVKSRGLAATELGSNVFIGKNELSDQFALEAVRTIAKHLRAAVHGGDRQSREAMTYGSLMAGLAFAAAGTGLAHALQYAVGAATRTPHGLGTGLLLPYVMDFIRPARTPELAQIASAMGLKTAKDPESAAAACVAAVRQLGWDIGIPQSLADIGVSSEDVIKLSRQAATVTRLVRLSPRPAGESELAAIMTAAVRGDVAIAEEAL